MRQNQTRFLVQDEASVLLSIPREQDNNIKVIKQTHSFDTIPKRASKNQKTKLPMPQLMETIV